MLTAEQALSFIRDYRKQVEAAECAARQFPKDRKRKRNARNYAAILDTAIARYNLLFPDHQYHTKE